jgi:hypothetical protein
MAGDPYFTSVSLLIPFDGSNGSTTFTDISTHGKTVSVASGTPIISTAQSKWGGSSLEISGAGTGSEDLAVTVDTDFQFGTGDFTVEGWFLPSVSGTSGRVFYHIGVNSSTGIMLAVSLDQVWWRRIGVGSELSASVSLSTTNFTHIAFVNHGGTQKIFVDGTRVASNATSVNVTDSGTLKIGASSAWFSDDNRYYGYIDDLRITKGVARYTGSTYTVPTAAFPDHSAQFTGNITESLAITDWRISAQRVSDGAYMGTATSSGSTYAVNVIDTSPCIITIHPKIDYAWSASKVVALGDLCVPSNPEATHKLYEATDIGSSPHQTHSTTEPTWPASGTVVDNDITWTFVADLVDPISLGPKIPT